MDTPIQPKPRQDKIRTHYFHLSNKVGLTMVSRPVKEMPTSIKVGMALTHPKDRGTKKDGFTLAKERLESLDSPGPGLQYFDKSEILGVIQSLRFSECILPDKLVKARMKSVFHGQK